MLLGQAEEKESDLQTRLDFALEEESKHKESLVEAEKKVEVLTTRVAELEASSHAQDEIRERPQPHLPPISC